VLSQVKARLEVVEGATADLRVRTVLEERVQALAESKGDAQLLEAQLNATAEALKTAVEEVRPLLLFEVVRSLLLVVKVRILAACRRDEILPARQRGVILTACRRDMRSLLLVEESRSFLSSKR